MSLEFANESLYGKSVMIVRPFTHDEHFGILARIFSLSDQNVAGDRFSTGVPTNPYALRCFTLVEQSLDGGTG